MGKSISGKILYWLGEISIRCRGIVYLLLFRGSRYTCPFCNHSFSKFLPVGYKHAILKHKKIVGGGYRENAACPFCASIDRERLVYLFITAGALLRQGMKVLHIAPERNLQQYLKGQNVVHLSADLDSPLAEMKMDIQDIHFPEDHFDAVICNHVLEHVPDDITAMKEIHRVLKHNGWAILQVPYSPMMQQSLEDPSVTGRRARKEVFGQANHVRMYGLDYEFRLKEAGFSVSLEKMDTAVVDKFALNPDESIFFCRK